jgi:hypothetical protein
MSTAEPTACEETAPFGYATTTREVGWVPKGHRGEIHGFNERGVLMEITPADPVNVAQRANVPYAWVDIEPGPMGP